MGTLFRKGLIIGIALGAITYPGVGQNQRDPAELYRLVKRFDFSERPLGNFENEPMYWRRFTGDGLPAYNRGVFDDAVGHDAPPSFKLQVQTGNVGYEYGHLDLTIVPGSDYVVRGVIKAEGLTYSRAFIAAYLVDRFGERIAGSDRVTGLVQSRQTPPAGRGTSTTNSTDGGRPTAASDEPWQPVELTIPGEFPAAYALRLQCWILQTSAWQSQDENRVDPIARHDVYGTAWFDDISIFRLPRARLRLSNPAGFVLPDRPESLIVDVNNATAQKISADVSIVDGAGRVRHAVELDVPSMTSAEWSPPRDGRASRSVAVADRQPVGGSVRTSIPPLAPGLYTAHMRLRNENDTLLERELRFAVLAPLPPLESRQLDIGVDLGCWRGGDREGLVELLSELGCGTVKIGVAMSGGTTGDGLSEPLKEIGSLAHELGKRQIEPIGVLLPPEAARDPGTTATVRKMVLSDSLWRTRCSPVFAHFGGMLTTWQLGDERSELQGQAAWTPEAVAAVREHLRRFVTVPQLIAPQSATSSDPLASSTVSVAAADVIPTRDLPRALERAAQDSNGSHWLRLESTQRVTGSQGLTDVARRFVLAKAMGFPRMYVDAPVRLVMQDSATVWEPTDEFLVLRTLTRYLTGKQLVASMSPAPDTTALVFRGAESSCMVLWSWQDEHASQSVSLYLGKSPRAIDLLGQEVPVEIRDEQTRLTVGPSPLIIEGLHAPLALLQASFHIAPTFLQAHNRDAQPLITFRNPYQAALSGEVVFNVPDEWRITPRVLSFDLAPGQTLEQALELLLPPRELASSYALGIKLKLRTPEEAELNFTQRLDVGLRDILVETRTRWEGTDLVVEQSVRNLTHEKIRFSGFCEAPFRARAEGLFLDIGFGEEQVRSYIYRNGRDLAGAALHLGVREIKGLRRLDQLVEVPKE